MAPALKPISKPPRKLSWWKRCLFGAVIAVVGIAICELASLAAIQFLITATLSELESMRRHKLEESATPVSEVVHPYLGWVLDPSSDQRISTSHGRIPVNDFGLFDDAAPIHRRSPEKVIVGIVGGSVGLNVAAEGGPTLLQTLRTSDRFRGKSIELVRLTMPGYKQPQQLILVTYLLTLGAEFDLIINVDGYNEVALHESENGLAGTHPSFPRAWYGRVSAVSDPRTAEDALKLMVSQRSRQRWAGWVSSLPFQKSALLNFVWWSIDQHYGQRVFQLNSRILAVKDQHPSYAVRGPRLEFADQAAMRRHLVEYWATCSKALNRLCESHGIEYHHVLPPNQYLEGSKPMELKERKAAYFIGDEYRYSLSAQTGYPLLVERGKSLVQEGIRFHDLTQLFVQFDEPLYGDICCHYNERGNALVAEAIGRAVSQTAEAR